MCMSIFSVRRSAVFGCQNVLTRRAWKHLYRKQIFAGSFWTHMACYLENRAHAARFMRPAIRRRGRRLLRVTAIQAGRSAARTKVSRVIQPTGACNATYVSILPWSSWVGLGAEAEISPD